MLRELSELSVDWLGFYCILQTFT